MGNTTKPDRVDLYLQWFLPAAYVNTEEEQELVNKFVALYSMSKAERDMRDECRPENLDKWRKAYKGVLNALKRDGTVSEKKSRQLQKMIYEIVESTIDNSIPMPKIQPRYKSDLPLVDVTENYLKFEADRILTKYINDGSERSTYVDGTVWYKVWWDSTDNTHERSGDVKIDYCTVDQIVPQPGIKDYKQLEYIFERKELSISRIYDLYGRIMTPREGGGNTIETISCYYLNENHVVGLFMWAAHSQQVICNEHDWQIRKVRKCERCGTINPTGDTCRNCGSHALHYVNATEEILDEDLYEIYNPYDANETDDENKRDEYQAKVFLTKGTRIPFYRITQLPFVPRPAVSSMDDIYGISLSGILLDNQDMNNKLLTKAADKTLKSGAVVTKPEKMKIGDTDDTFKVFGVRTAEEAAMVQSKQILADTSQDIVLTNLIYDSGKAASGITDSFQGAKDTTATSGKAKQYAAAQSAGRIESLRVMKTAAFSGIYELLLKYLLAFSDETRSFVKVLPDGSTKEEQWNKYMFLAKDKYGEIYYRDDLHFSTDTAATLTQNRQAMWQETTDKFIQGAFGVPSESKTLELYWNTMNSFQYPLAKVALAGIRENSNLLPDEVQRMITSNPQLMQQIQQMMSGGDGRGGARPNSGPEGNGATHAANVERTNERNRAASRDIVQSAQQGGGIS